MVVVWGSAKMPIGALLAGLLMGHVQGTVESREAERKQQLQTFGQLFRMAAETGDVSALKVADPKLMKQFGIDPQIVPALEQMLAPIRERHQLQTEVARSQLGESRARTRRAEAETTEIEETAAARQQLSPEERKISQFPEVGRAQIAREKLGLEERTTPTVEQQQQMSREREATQLKIAGMHDATQLQVARMHRDTQMETLKIHMKAETDRMAKAELSELGKAANEAHRALSSIETKVLNKHKKNEVYDSQEQAQADADLFNQAAESWDMTSTALSQRMGTPAANVGRRAVVKPVARSGLIGGGLQSLGALGPSGYVVSIEGQQQATQPQATTQPTAQPDETMQRLQERVRQKQQGGAK
jgi:hypothetical protein